MVQERKELSAFLSTAEIDDTVQRALQEDVRGGDATTLAVVAAGQQAAARIVAKQSGTIAGLPVVERVFSLLDKRVSLTFHKQEGDRVEPGDCVVELAGPARALLTGERTALNFLGHLSGIAGEAAYYASLTAGKHLTILDTRKTTPLLRMLEKYAVQTGGCGNHRTGLYDMVLIKENHQRVGGGITETVRKARETWPELKIEVETTDLAEIREALSAGADRIMFDNMSNEQIAEAVALVDGRCETEASGNMDEQRIRELADSGVDFISVGRLTHSVTALDLSMLFDFAEQQ